MFLGGGEAGSTPLGNALARFIAACPEEIARLGRDWRSSEPILHVSDCVLAVRPRAVIVSHSSTKA